MASGGFRALAEEVATVALLKFPRGSRPEYAYGTAGFRAPADGLDHIFFRMGVLAALRSKTLSGAPVGVMVTASHNPERDNGVKIVEPMGEMLLISWEVYATKLANAADDQLAAAICEVAEAVGAKAKERATVFVGRDTRGSSTHLALAVCDGIGALRPAVSRSLGLTTTPQLHYVVRCEATSEGYGIPSLPGYVNKLVKAYTALIGSGDAKQALQKYQPSVVLDCANGVGADAMRLFLPKLKAAGLEVELANTGEGVLNEGCGADFVKVGQCQPPGVDTSARRGLSFDGDADRIVYFCGGAGSNFRLLDGDRLALLLAQFAAKLLKQAKLEEKIRLGVVQTAYANGASTRIAVQAVGEKNVICAMTGVKHCHHAALALDVGIYFEANGHGTVLFSDKFVQCVTQQADTQAKEEATAARQLLLLRDVINEAVGDAISNMLAVEAVLRLMDWSCAEWLAMYDDLPNRQVKVKVANRSVFETTDAERICVKPEGLQAEIDKLVSKTASGRAFVRPSGTEDVVRVYAEGATQEAMIALAQEVVDLVYDRAGGVGERPKVS